MENVTDNPYTTANATTPPKEMWIAYLLVGIFSCLGAHRFYLRRNGTAVAQLLLTLSLFGILVSLPWVVVDLFLIPRMTREENAKLAAEWDRRHSVEPVDDGGFISGPGLVQHTGWPK